MKYTSYNMLIHELCAKISCATADVSLVCTGRKAKRETRFSFHSIPTPFVQTPTQLESQHMTCHRTWTLTGFPPINTAEISTANVGTEASAVAGKTFSCFFSESTSFFLTLLAVGRCFLWILIDYEIGCCTHSQVPNVHGKLTMHSIQAHDY